MRIWHAVAVGTLLLPAVALAEDEEAESDAEEAPDGEFLLGDLGRKGLADKGLTLEAELLDDVTRVQRGGVETGDTAHRWWLDVEAGFDLSRVGLPEGLSIHAAYWWIGGEHGSRDAGAVQWVSGYESTSRSQLAELYLDFDFAEAWKARVGKFDATYLFTATEYGEDFMNVGVSFPPNLYAIPVYPDPSAGVALLRRPEAGLQLGAAVMDGALHEGVRTGTHSGSTLLGPPSDLYAIAEAGWAGKSRGGPFRAALGAWRHTGEFARWSGGTKDGMNGFYGILEGRICGPAEERGLYGILRATTSDAAVKAIERHWVAAGVWRGPCAGRPDDAAGLAFLQADLTDEPAAGYRHSSERVLEAYYKVQVTGFLSIQPGIQRISHPGGRPGAALVVGLRTVIDF